MKQRKQNFISHCFIVNKTGQQRFCYWAEKHVFYIKSSTSILNPYSDVF